MRTRSLICNKVAQIKWWDWTGIDSAVIMRGDSAYDKKY